MILRKIELENYGSFKGFTEIDLLPKDLKTKSKPIILIGGKNGSGKTTLLNAIKICLYGAESIGLRVSNKEYNTFLKKLIHRNTSSLIPLDTASVAIEFDYSTDGQVSTYRVKRRWQIKKKGFIEDLTIESDNDGLKDISKDEWQEFIKNILPPGILELIFFDGEKIQKLAEDSSTNEHLENAINSLFNIDLINGIMSDLKYYKKTNLHSKVNKELENDSKRIDKESKKLKKELDKLTQDYAGTNSEILSLAARIEKENRKFATEGGLLAEQREKLLHERSVLNERVENLKQELRELCAGLLPFALVPSLNKKLLRQINIEIRSEKDEILLEVTKKIIYDLEKALKKEALWKIIPNKIIKKSKDDFVNKLMDSFRITPSKKTSLKNIRHDLSKKDADLLKSWINNVKGNVLIDANKIEKRLTRDLKSLESIERKISRMPSDEVMKPFLIKINSMNKKSGILESALKRQFDEIKYLKNKLDLLIREENSLGEKFKIQSHNIQQFHNLTRTNEVLIDFKKKLLINKLKELESSLTECYGFLSNKKDVIKKITINPKSFEVTLISKWDEVISKDQLSAGEKQIFAISLLWAILDTSKRSLPVIIDTPLARLDSDHRLNIIEKYFPVASHQVILLSTDTEVDKSFFNMLNGHISKAYQISFNKNGSYSNIIKGYFWKSKEIEHAA